MIHVGKKTNDSPREVIEKAARFFGPGGVGLQVTFEEENAIYMVGSGGHVQVSAVPITSGDDGMETDVDIVSREWEKQAKDFLSEI